MRKALKQNPNMIRTMLGLAFSLILLLSYAVYGATMNPDYYVYQNSQTESNPELALLDVSTESETTTWIWTFDVNPNNLTWINATLENNSFSGNMKMINVAGEYWSHEKLADSDAKDFVCAEEIRENDKSYWIPFDCTVSTTHSRQFESGNVSIIGLSHPDPAKRNGGTVYAQNITAAENIARNIVDTTHISSQWQLILELDSTDSNEVPDLSVTFITEEFNSIEQFGLDAATEMLWSFAALFGCFAMLLVPSLSVYFAAMYKENKRKISAQEIISSDEEE